MTVKGLTYDTIFQQAPIGIAITYSSADDVNNNFVSINQIFQQITGRTKEELIKIGWIKITHPDDVEEDISNFNKLQSGEIKSYSMEKRYIKPDGSIVWVDMVVASLTLSDEHMNNQICLVQDITERKRLERELLESERSKSVLLSNLPGMAYKCNYDCHWTMQFVSAGCYQLTGYTSDDLLYNRRLSYNDIILPKYRETLRNEWERILGERLPFRYEYEIVTANGERKWVLEMGQGIYSELGDVEALEGIILDISDRKEIENNLRYNNEHDQWTGLYNRRYLENLLANDAELITTNKRALIGINLSAVQRLSLTYGFHYSQEVIKKVAKALSLLCTDKRKLFNTYENRFVFYIKDYRDKDELIVFCEEIDKTLGTIFAAEGLGSGIGIVEIDADNKHDVGQILKNLLNASEKAIYHINNSLGFCFFDKDMEAEIMREEDIIKELMLVESDESDGGLYLQYQPILDLKSNQICGFEALARLKSDKLGFVSPLEFIPLAEKTKLIIPIGQKIIIKAFGFLNRLRNCGYRGINMSINVSSIQLLREEFNRDLFDIIADMNVNPENVGLEITESLFVDNYQEINRILGELKSYGIRIAIDDFGTGYSSLARERELNISCLKIDKYFIDKLLLLKEEEAITGVIISMAHKLGHCVVAEGVEYEEQRLYLEKYKCDKIQGYLISKPLDEDAAIAILKEKNHI
ncbi:MAG: EAL domain-containing protein [Clostridiales bacterium]|jgi:PAS domain S-box-containing protein|nr:EAL domain-containing protein [Clostridiales bacterium]